MSKKPPMAGGKTQRKGKEKRSTKNLEYVFLSVTTTQHTCLLDLELPFGYEGTKLGIFKRI